MAEVTDLSTLKKGGVELGKVTGMTFPKRTNPSYDVTSATASGLKLYSSTDQINLGTFTVDLFCGSATLSGVYAIQDAGGVNAYVIDFGAGGADGTWSFNAVLTDIEMASVNNQALGKRKITVTFQPSGEDTLATSI